MVYFTLSLLLDLESESKKKEQKKFLWNYTKNENKLSTGTQLILWESKSEKFFQLHRLFFQKSLGYEEFRIEGNVEMIQENQYRLTPNKCKIFVNKTLKKRWVLLRIIDCDHNKWDLMLGERNVLNAQSLQEKPIELQIGPDFDRYPPGIVWSESETDVVVWNLSGNYILKRSTLQSEKDPKLIYEIENGNDSMVWFQKKVPKEKILDKMLFVVPRKSKEVWED